MRSSKGLIKLIDIRKLIFDFIWISCFGIIATILVTNTGYLYNLEYSPYPIVHALRIVAVIAGIRYSTKLMKISTSKTTADFAYSLPISKTQYYFSKFAAVAIMELLTLIVVGVIGGIVTVNLISFSWLFAGDIIMMILESFVIALLITSIMFLSLSATGKKIAVYRLFVGIFLFPMVFPLSCDLFAMYEARIGNVGLLTVPNLYLPTNAIFLQNRMNIVYYGMGKAMLFNLLLVVIYLGVGLYLFHKRDAQTTSSYTINKWINYISMSVLPFFIIYFTWRYVFRHIYFEYYHAYQDYFELPITISIFGLSLLILYLYDMKKFGKLRLKNKCIPIFIILMIFSAGTIYGIHESTYKPERISIDSDNIDHINLVFTGFSHAHSNYNERLSYGGLMAKKVDIVNKDIFNDISDYCADEKNKSITGGFTVPLAKVTMKNGKTEYVSLQKDKMFSMPSTVHYYGDEIIKAYFQCPRPEKVKELYIEQLISLTDEQMDDIYSTYYNEMTEYTDRLYSSDFITQFVDGSPQSSYNYIDFFVISRVGLNTTYDFLNVSENTPETVHKIYETHNEICKNNVIDRINNINTSDFCMINLISDGEMIGGCNIRHSNDYNEKCHIQVKEILENNDWSTPEVGNKILRIYYIDDINNFENYNGGSVYLKLTDEEYEALYEYIVIYEDIEY